MSGKRIIRVFSKRLPSRGENVFPLLCPVREYEWIPTWECKIVYTDSGYAELGCVFITDFGDSGGAETWVVCSYEKDSLIGFVKTGEHLVTRYTVSLKRDISSSVITWEQEITSLDKKGEQLLGEMTPDAYEAKMVKLNNLLEQYLLYGDKAGNHESDNR